MKRIMVALFLALLLLGVGTNVFAKTGAGTDNGFEVDGSLGVATGPGNFGDGYGVNFGAGYMLSSIDQNLQARVDISYFDFSYNYFLGSGYDLSYTRVPITVSARYYFPINDQWKAFAQAGIETSFDSIDYVDAFNNKQSKTEVNIGLSPGGGIEFSLNPAVSFFAVGRVHMVSDSYVSVLVGAAFHF